MEIKNNNYIYIQYQREDNTFNNYSSLSDNIIKLYGDDNDRYCYMQNNKHHYTTKYQYEIAIPKIMSLLECVFDINEFKYINNIFNESGKRFDLSYLKPIKDCKYIVKNLEFNIKYECDFDGLIYNEHSNKDGLITEYHKLFCFPHSSTLITNKNSKYNKNIVISGDSQMIPVIPILSYYFRNILYLDNRSGKTKLNDHQELKLLEFDYVIFELFDKPVNYYILKNFDGFINNNAIISLTSWKNRINTVHKTIENLLTVCRGYLIVLVLSIDEFPNKEKDLPQNLIDNKNIFFRILWDNGNRKTLKKIYPTMIEYGNIPIVSADDDCLYTRDYVSELYEFMTNNKSSVVRYNMYNKDDNWQFTQGPCTIYNGEIGKVLRKYDNLFSDKRYYYDDDGLITNILKKENIHISHIYRGDNFPFTFHDEINPLNNNKNNEVFKKCYMKQKVLLCSMGKMENNYIREWVEHNKQLGFDNIVLYDNNDIDGEHFEDVIGDYINSGYVILNDARGRKGVIDLDGKGTKYQQIECFDECYQTIAKKYDWVMFCDIDEFLHIEDTYTIQDFLEQNKFRNYNCIKINWKYYDDDGLPSVKDNDYSIKRFTNHSSAITENIYCKIIVKTNIGAHINSAHGFRTDRLYKEENKKVLKICNVKGEDEKTVEHITSLKPIHECAWINHYRFKTIEEFITKKLKRKWPSNHDKVEKLNLERFFLCNKKTDLKIKKAIELAGQEEVDKLSQNNNKYKTCIVIPLLNETPDKYEVESIKRALTVFKNRKVFTICKQGFNLDEYKKIESEVNGAKIFNYFMPEKNMINDSAINEMYKTYGFYSLFKNYDYMLLYDLKSLALVDNLDYFTSKNYDYVGALHFDKENSKNIAKKSGDGSATLRKVSKMLELCKKYVSEDRTISDYEFFVEKHGSEITMCHLKDAMKFSFNDEPATCFLNNEKKFPMIGSNYKDYYDAIWHFLVKFD